MQLSTPQHRRFEISDESRYVEGCVHWGAVQEDQFQVGRGTTHVQHVSRVGGVVPWHRLNGVEKSGTPHARCNVQDLNLDLREARGGHVSLRRIPDPSVPDDIDWIKGNRSAGECEIRSNGRVPAENHLDTQGDVAGVFYAE